MNKNKKIGGWDFALWSVKYLVDNGLGVILVIAAALIGLAWVLTRDLTSADRASMMVQLARSPMLAFSGWFVAICEFFAFKVIYGFLTKTHSQEMGRIADVKNEAIQERLPFELKSSIPSKLN